jgi:rubrerythrin
VASMKQIPAAILDRDIMAKSKTATAADIERYRANYLVEKDGIALYRAMAAADKDDKRAEIFEKLAQNEERHAQRWARLARCRHIDRRRG